MFGMGTGVTLSLSHQPVLSDGPLKSASYVVRLRAAPCDAPLRGVSVAVLAFLV